MSTTISKLVLGALAAGTFALSASSVTAEPNNPATSPAYPKYAENYSSYQLESITSSERLRAIGSSPSTFAPTEIWRALEHGEKVDCLDCIPGISKLLWNEHNRTREISAWWLRRRIFGVFGPGEVYSQVVGTLRSGNGVGQPNMSSGENQRAYAANALGEFLSVSGVKFVAAASTDDPSAKVRKAAVEALRRLNNQGPRGEVALAMADADEQVRLAALDASLKINVFAPVAGNEANTGLTAVVKLVSDSSPLVRKRAAEVLGAMRASDAVVGLIALTTPDQESDPEVRAAAVYALGRIGDVSARTAAQAAQNDPNGFVRDAARIALRRL